VEAGKTPLYAVVKKANWRVREWAPKLEGSTSVGLFANTGAADTEEPAPGKLVERMDDNVLVGVLTKGNQPPRAVIVDARVSRELGKPARRKVEVAFNEAVKSALILAGSDDETDTTVDGNVVAVDLDAGEGQLVALQGGDELRAILPKLRPLPQRITNLTTGKPVRSSGPEHGSYPLSNLVDGWATTESSWWSAGQTPVWVEVDLQEEHPLTAVQVFPYWGDGRYYQYKVEVSPDAATWTQVADMSRTTTPAAAEGNLHKFPKQNVRYVRVNVLQNSANPNAHLAEVRVFADQ